MPSKRLAEIRLDPGLDIFGDAANVPEALLAAIKESGPVHALVVDEDGSVLDGRKLYQVYTKLRVAQAPVVVHAGLSQEEKRLLRISLNLNRRHMTRKQIRGLIMQELTWWLANKGVLPTDTRLATAFGVSHNTVKAVRESNRQFDGCPQEGADGRVWRPRVPCLLHQVKGVKERIATAGEELPGGVVPAKGVWQAGSRAEKKKLLAEEGGITPGGEDYRLLHGDYRTLLAPLTNAARLVLTDPLWQHEDALERWTQLGAMARRVLVPGGCLLAYSGVGSLNLAFRGLDRHLSYLWTLHVDFTTLHPVGRGRQLQVANGWRPVLLYVRDRLPPDRVYKVFDRRKGAGKTKTHHPYQQNVQEFVDLIRLFSRPGELVVDPFSGSFAVACACKLTKRRFLGCEIDPTNYQLGLRHFAEYAEADSPVTSS
jgi:hypothetical protein